MVIDGETAAVVSVALEIFALLVTALLRLSCLLAQDRHGRGSRLFFAMLTVNAAALVCDMITWIWEAPQYAALMYVANFFVFSLGYVISVLFTAYLKSYITEPRPLDGLLTNGIYALGAVAVALVVVSLFNGMYFSVQDGVLVGGELGWLSVALALVMMLGDMALMLYHRRELGEKNIFGFLSYCVFPILGFVVQMLGTAITVTWLASTLTMLLIYLMVHIEAVRKLDRKRAQLAENRLRLSQSERELSESRTALMLSQIQPHFLYNSLAVIDRLCKTDPAMARRAVAEFSTYLRCNLSSLKHSGPIPFTEELRHIQAYLSLEKMRFGELLNVRYEIEADGFFVPALSVQPLVENAVQHGLCEKEQGGTVVIASREQNDRWQVTIRDDGVGFVRGEVRGGGAHIGIESIRRRLQAMCGGVLEIESVPGQGTTATISIPKENEAAGEGAR